MVELSPNRRLFSCWALLVLLGSGGCCWRLAKAWGYLVSQPAAPRVEAEERRAVRLAANRRIQEFQRAAAERRAYAESRRRKRLRPIPNPPEWVASFSETEITGIHWAAEVLNVPPGSLSRHNSDDNTHDKEEDEGTADAAAAGVTRPAGSRPSSEEMLQRGYMLRKGDTLSCKMLILTNDRIMNVHDVELNPDATFVEQDGWSRQNHVAYAVERGYCLVHARCVNRRDGAGMVELETPGWCSDVVENLGLQVLVHLFKEVLVSPANSYVAKLNVDAFITDFNPRFEDFFKLAEKLLSRVEHGMLPPLRVETLPTAVAASPLQLNVSVVAAASSWCSASSSSRFQVVLWRANRASLRVLRSALNRGGLEGSLKNELQLNPLNTRIMCEGLLRTPENAAGRTVINWSPSGAVVVFAPRAFNAVVGLDDKESGVHFWRPGDFIANLRLDKDVNLQLSKVCAKRGADATSGRESRESVCPWLRE